MPSTPLPSGSPLFQSLSLTQPDTHLHLDTASDAYHLHQFQSHVIGSMIIISHFQ